jgi:hypothetical protein
MSKKCDDDDAIATAVFLPILVMGFLNFIRPFIWIIFGVIVLRVIVYVLSLYSEFEDDPEDDKGDDQDQEDDQDQDLPEPRRTRKLSVGNPRTCLVRTKSGSRQRKPGDTPP